MIPGGIRPTTWETLLCVWETFTGVRDGKNARSDRLIVYVLLALGIAFAVISTFHLETFRGLRGFSPSLPPTALDTDTPRLRSLADELKLASQQRARGALWVQAMRERGRDLFARLTPEPSIVPELSIPDISIDPPPEIVVKAVMKSDKSWAVVVDIAGAGSGLILRPGDSFMEGRGKIVRMDGDRLIVRWDGREWAAVPGLF